MEQRVMQTKGTKSMGCDTVMSNPHPDYRRRPHSLTHRISFIGTKSFYMYLTGPTGH